jgi:hypothetical protein
MVSFNHFSRIFFKVHSLFLPAFEVVPEKIKQPFALVWLVAIGWRPH